jgi:peptide/nickel transport system permease protein
MNEIPISTAAEAKADVQPSSQALRRLYVVKQLLHSTTFTIGAAILFFWVSMALFSEDFTRYGPLEIDPLNTLAPPSTLHWLGTDDLGRDVLSRMLAGAGPVLTVAPLSTLLALAAGTAIALVAGYYRGLVDELLMRGVDVLLAIPVVIAGIVVLSLLGSSVLVVILVIAVLFTPSVARTVRASVVAEREREYVKAARLLGERSWFVLIAEILPNCLSSIIVEGTVRLGYAVFTAATLSFLGFGLQPPSPDWGLTISLQRHFIQVAPWTTVFPALALATLVVGANLVADGLRRTLSE